MQTIRSEHVTTASTALLQRAAVFVCAAKEIVCHQQGYNRIWLPKTHSQVSSAYIRHTFPSKENKFILYTCLELHERSLMSLHMLGCAHLHAAFCGAFKGSATKRKISPTPATPRPDIFLTRLFSRTSHYAATVQT